MPVDGANDPTVFNTSLAATDVTESSVEGASLVAAYREHMFYAGMSSTPQEVVFSEPFNEDGFNSGQGAGSIKVDDTVVALKVFRDSLFIFCENRIFKLTGSSSSDFSVQPVTRNIGCINSFTVQEFAGDLIFLGPDGLRTVAATARIGDTELGTISKNIQTVFDENIKDAQNALKRIMERYSSNCRFIITCNDRHRIIQPLISRTANYQFRRVLFRFK